MDRRPFLIMLAALVITFIFTTVIRSYRPDASEAVGLSELPLTIEGWQGVPVPMTQDVLKLLNPVDYFSANYINNGGIEVNIFVDYFSSGKGGGPHSPRNCMPGSGWVIENTTEREIKLDDRTITCHRLDLRLGEIRKVMDFWYVTRFGETANDYLFKLYGMLSALSLHATDVAFVRFVSETDEESIAAMEEFQQRILPEISQRLPF